MSPATKPKVVAMIVASAIVMQQIDATVITTALPQMAISLDSDPVTLSVAVTAYLLSVAVFIPVSGWVADRFGGRTVFRAAIALFTLGSVLCGSERQRGRAHRRAGAAGLRRRHDGAGRAARPVPQRRALAAGAHHGLSAGAGAARPGARAADRRLHHHLFLLALDLSGQRAARHPRHRAGDALLRQPQGGRAAPARLDRLPAHRRLALLHPVRHRGDRARPRRMRRWPIGLLVGGVSARRLRAAASAAPRASAARPVDLPHPDLPGQHRRRLAVPRRCRQPGLPAAAPAAGRVRHDRLRLRRPHLRHRGRRRCP